MKQARPQLLFPLLFEHHPLLFEYDPLLFEPDPLLFEHHPLRCFHLHHLHSFMSPHLEFSPSHQHQPKSSIPYSK